MVSVIILNLFKNYLNLFSNKFITNFNINQNNLLLLNDNIPAKVSRSSAHRTEKPNIGFNLTSATDMLQKLMGTHIAGAINTHTFTQLANDSKFLQLIGEDFNTTSSSIKINALSNLYVTETTSSPVAEITTTAAKNATLEEQLDSQSTIHIIIYFLSNVTDHSEFFLFFVLLTVATMTIFGNLLVIVSINVYKKLHTPTNYLIKNLAFTDLLVGIVIMPVAALHDIAMRGNWPFGVNFCDFWRSMDVLLSTTSILNLCFISYDRYYALQNPFGYKKVFTKNLIKCFCALSWVLGIGISFPAIIWWRFDRQYYMPHLKCLFTSNQVYLVLSSIVSFYIPLSVMIVFYWKIYRLAMEQNLSLRMGKKKILILKKKKKKKRKDNFLRNSASALPFFMASLIPAKPMGDSNEEEDEADESDDEGGVVFQNLRVHRGRGNSETTASACHKTDNQKARHFSAGSVQILNEKPITVRNSEQPIIVEDLTSMSIPNNLNLVMNKPKCPSQIDPSTQGRRTGSEPEVQSLSCKSPSGANPYHSSADAMDLGTSSGRAGSMEHDPSISGANNNQQWGANPLAILMRFNQNIQKRKRFYFLSLKMSREKKAAKTLSIVMGVFLLCWCPFFICNLCTSFFADDVLIESVFGGNKSAFELLMSVVGWFGWLNSLLNPIIYASWSTEFRRAFQDVIKRYFYRCCWMCGGKSARQQLSRTKFKRQSKRYYKR